MIARLLAAAVGVVLALAGAAKVVDMGAWMRDARAQGVWPFVAALVPPIELALGAAMVVLAPSAWVLGAATTLLLVFTVFLVASIAAGSAVPCACFGAVRRRAPSWRDVVRNVALMGALFVAAALG